MTLDADAYRTLGLSRGATLDEVKRAYRRLAKANHPDAAGAAALPRFLAIQAAYEQLAGGPDVPRARGSAAGPAASRSSAAGPGAPRSSARPGTGRAPGSDARGPASKRRRRPSEPRAGEPRAGAGGGPSSEGRRDPTDGPQSKATLGSTSYDGADSGPFEPDWGGASWYGTTSGTYWTLNPKEYADPRKHGPEYQARARRAARARASASNAADQTTTDAAGPDRGATGDDPPRSAGPAPGPMHTTSSWWDSTAGSTGTPSPGEGDAAERPRPRAGSARAADVDPSPPDLGRAAAEFVRALLDERSGGLRGRVMRAIIGWLPIAFGFGWLVGELTGCGRFAATCDGSADPFVLIVQVAVLVVLLLLPTLAALAAMASIALLATAVVASLILSATGTAADGDSRRAALGALLLLAWLAGLSLGVVRRVRTLGSPTSPVS